MDTVLNIALITTNPSIRGGRPCISGTGLRVIDVVMAHLFHQQRPDEIAAIFGVSLAGVYAALAYYFEHKLTVDEDIRAQVAITRELRARWIADGGTPLLP